MRHLLREELAANNISAGGGGSVKRGTAAQVWCVFKKNTHEILHRSASVVRGDPSSMTSLHPETVSSIAAGTFLNIIASTIPNIQTTVIFHSDNEAAVKNSQRASLHDVGTVLENDIDVTTQNVRIVKNL